MNGEIKKTSTVKTVLKAAIFAFVCPFALALLTRAFYCYACNHLYTLTQSQIDVIWYVSDVVAELGVFFGIGATICGATRRARLSWIFVPVVVIYAALCPIVLYTVEFSSGIFIDEETAAEGLATAMGTLETYYIYIITALIVTFVYITAHTARAKAGKAKLSMTAGFLSPRFLPSATGYTFSAFMLLVVIVSSIIVGNGFAAFALSLFIALLRTVFVFLGIRAFAGNGG